MYRSQDKQNSFPAARVGAWNFMDWKDYRSDQGVLREGVLVNPVLSENTMRRLLTGFTSAWTKRQGLSFMAKILGEEKNQITRWKGFDCTQEN